MSPACREAAQDQDFATAVVKDQLETNPRARRYMRAVDMQMTPFHFEGRVVDRQGEPIEGAEVVYQIGYPYSLGYEDPASTTTDEQGRFSLKGRGYSLFIRTIRHPGLTPAPGFQKNREFGSDPRKGHISWSQATAESPREFVLMRGQSFE